MREFRAEQTSVSATWKFEKMLPSLPVPNTPAFSILRRDLMPYGLAPSGITIETPTNRLGDVGMGISLLNNRLALRISYSDFELVMNSVGSDDGPKIAAVADVLLEAFRVLDPDNHLNLLSTKINAHLNLGQWNTGDFLGERLTPVRGAMDFIPQGFAYSVTFDVGSYKRTARVAVTESALIPNSIYIEILFEAFFDVSLDKLAAQLGDDIKSILSALGLAPVRV